MNLQYQFIKEWILSRLKERTSWDGAIIITVCVLTLLALPFVKWLAWGGILYGAWTLWKREDEN